MRSLAESVALGMWVAGLVCLGGALVGARLNWRSDVATSKFWTSGSDLAVHPEKYVSLRTATVVRALNLAGVLLLALAILAVVGAAVVRWFS